MSSTNMSRPIAIILALTLIMALSGCLHGPLRNDPKFEGTAQKPFSNTLAVAVDFSVVRDPKGLATFPNGGYPRVISRELRIYIIDLDLDSVDLLAVLEDFGGVPVPRNTTLREWRDDGIDLTIEGYGSTSARSGDDYDDPRKVFLHLSPNGDVTKIEARPKTSDSRHDQADNESDFRIIRSTFEEVVMQMTDASSGSERLVFLRLDETSGHPYLSP